MSLNSFREKFARDIKTNGWTVITVFANTDRGVPGFAYTVGLTALGHAELLILGLPPEFAHQILNTIAKKLINKQLSGVHLEMIAEAANFALRFKTSGSEGEEFAKWAGEFAREKSLPVKVLHVEFPDESGNFPGDPACDSRIAMLQNLMALSILMNEDSAELPPVGQYMH